MSDDRRRARRRFGLDNRGNLGDRREGSEPIGRARSRIPAPARRRAERERARPRPAGTDTQAPQPPVAGRWRLLAIGLAVLEVALVLVLCLGPTFKVREIEVRGATRIGGSKVVEASGVTSGSSIFLVNSRAVVARLDGQVWVRAASVQTQFPSTVQITVDEWEPVALYTPRGEAPVYLSSQGTILGAARSGATAGLTPIDGPDTGTAPGHLALDARLLRPLVNIQQGLPGLINQKVTRFQLDTCWNLTMYAGSGWRAIFGRMLTPGDYATLQQKVSALRSVASQVDFNDPTTYVNLENPSEVTIGHGPDVAPTPTPSPTPSPGTTPSPKPTATPTPKGPVSVVTPTPKATPSITPSPTPAAQGACS